MSFSSLSGEQIRQLIDTEQLYEAFRAAQTERDQRFRGSMAWKRVRGRNYLYRKKAGVWQSLGPRNEETETAYGRFHAGRSAVRERIAGLDHEIRRMAPINRAMRLGRVPWAAARLLRKLERRLLLGRAISVVGTHALYAYERLAGGRFAASQVATSDIDLLFDSRRQLHLLAPETRREGLAGILKSADPSFEAVSPGGFRAVNGAGFMVDLITPMPARPAGPATPKRVGIVGTDLTAAEIEGLAWLNNCPQVDAVVIDERGYPLRLHVPDPRAFALHKLWVSKRHDRDRLKAVRDAAQALAVAGLVVRHLPQFRFDDEAALSALPLSLKAQIPDLLEKARRSEQAEAEDW